MNMKRLFIILLTISVSVALNAQKPGYYYTEASELTLIGKILDGTPCPYHRVDTVRYKGFTATENVQVRCSAGIGVVFRTNSTRINIGTRYGHVGYPSNTNGFSARGYDLYIKRDGQWIYAESGVAKDNNLEKPFTLISDMDDSMKECLLYLPLYSEVKSVQIGVENGSVIEPIENPFRHRVAVFGSSYTHGSSTSRSGMSYVAQLERNTGIHFMKLGCSGNSKLQPYFCDVLCDAQADAFLLDAFSNPSVEQIKERLFPFIEKLQAAHPGKPIIFSATIYREARNFNQKLEKSQKEIMETADSLMQIAVKKYPDVYYIRPAATSPDHNATVDGTHPDQYGYTLWAKSIEKPLLKILKKYGIK